MSFVPLVGRTIEQPDRDLFYWLEGETDDGYVEVRRPGNDSRRFVGRAVDFRQYGEAMMERVNPTLRALPLPERHTVRERLVALADRDWDTHGREAR